MAPLIPRTALSGAYVRQVSRSISTSHTSIQHRTDEQAIPPLGPLLTFVTKHTSKVVDYISRISRRSSTPLSDALILPKRQSGAILAIPTTYAGLNTGPQPGSVVGIVLGSVCGFLLLLYLLYTAINLSGYFGNTVVEEEIIRRRSRSPRQRSVSRSETVDIQSEARSPPRRERSRRETIVVEERIRQPSPPPEDDIVEVIEEHSPERRPARRESKKASGFRTIDPAEYGGGDRPMRKVSRR